MHRGVYAVGHPALTREQGWLAAVLACGPAAVLSHRSAAALWGLSGSEAVEVTVARWRPGPAGVAVRSSALPADEVTVHRGIPVTIVPRVILDLAAVAPRRVVERSMHEAEVRRLGAPLSLATLLARHPRHRGTATVRAIRAAAREGIAVTRSELEERFLAFAATAGLPRPQVNRQLRVAGGLIEADCVWPDRRLVVELDGHAAHATATAYERDRARDRALAAAGWRVVRITWRQLHHRPAELARDLGAILRLAPGSTSA
jgi:very-short-patch-repair endonuclease